MGSVDAQGTLAVSMDSPRSVNRVAISADLSGQSSLLRGNLSVSAGLAATKGGGPATYTFDIGREGRRVLAFAGSVPERNGRLSGTWKIDIHDSDLAPFFQEHTLPRFSATGDGRFDADADLSRIHALGGLSASASGLGFLAPSLDRLGPVKLDASFDLTRDGQSLSVDSLSATVTGTRPFAVVRLLRPFEVRQANSTLEIASQGGDWLDVSVQGLPVASLSGLVGRYTLAGGDAAGEFIAGAAGGVFFLRGKAPLTARGVSLLRDGRALVQGVDLSLSMTADYGHGAWHAQWAPLSIECAGRHLATTEGKASQPESADQPTAVAGTWSADLGALASSKAAPESGWISGRTASGDFSANVAGSAEVDAKVLVAGDAPGDSITASVHADVGEDGSVEFKAPVRIASGPSITDVSAEGIWSSDETGVRLDAKLIGANVVLEHLRTLAAPFAAAVGASMAPGAAGPEASTGLRDKAAFWGDWTGGVTVSFDRLQAGSYEFKDVGGAFNVDHGLLRLQSGRGGFQGHMLTNVEGSVSFDAAAESPYTLKATAPDNPVEAASFFGPAKPGQDPVIGGRFNLSSALRGSGRNLGDLFLHTRAEFLLTSTTGIVRLLATDISPSVPEVSSPVRDTVGSVGKVVGVVLGVRDKSAELAKSPPLAKNTDAVLNFTYQTSEILFDQITIHAVRGPDGTVDLDDIEMTSPEVHLKGSGRISHSGDLKLPERPLSIDLQLGAKGKPAELLATAGLLSPGKDALGYSMLSQSLHFGGTLEQIDGSQWNALLSKAATPKSEGAKKASD